MRRSITLSIGVGDGVGVGGGCFFGGGVGHGDGSACTIMRRSKGRGRICC